MFERTAYPFFYMAIFFEYYFQLVVKEWFVLEGKRRETTGKRYITCKRLFG
jgi:hypothetical protein